MDFELSDDERALAEGIDAFVRGRMPLERLRTFEGQTEAPDQRTWGELAETGVLSLLVPADAGGLGLDLRHGAVVFERLGAHLVPGPLVPSVLLAGTLEGVAEGRRRVGWARGLPPRSHTPALIEHLASLDALVVLPGPGEGEAHLLTDLTGLRESSRLLESPLDPLTPLAEVTDPSCLAGGEALPAQRTADLLRQMLVLAAAQQAGMAQALTELATSYAKERRQFGRPIGGFQAVKHLCADMVVRAELARSAVHAAATLGDQDEAAADEAEAAGTSPEEVRQRAAAEAKLLADKAAVANARSAIQVHGGMGFTWELPLHLYLKRAHVVATSFAGHDVLAEAVAALVEPSRAKNAWR